MFTGLVEAYVPVRSISRRGAGAVLSVERPAIFDDLSLGDSVAVDGVCLTATRVDARSFDADVSEETLSRSTLGTLRAGRKVNLERAMSAGSRFGGHMVSGHVDATVRFLGKTAAGASSVYRFELPQALSRLVVDKGSVALAGISLTVADLGDDEFSVAVIPHTEQVTGLGALAPGDLVNFEADGIGKYVARILGPHVESESRDARLRELLGGL